MAEEKRTTSQIKSYLDNIFGKEGLKTDIKVTLTNDTMFKIIGTGLVVVVGGSVAFFIIRELFKGKQKMNISK